MEKEITISTTEQLEKIILGKQNREQKIQKIENMLTRKLGGKVKYLMDKALELAEGVYMMDDKDPYKIKYYKTKPDLDAIIYLTDRLLGKPVAKSEIKDDTNKKGIAAVQDIITQLAGVGINALQGKNQTIRSVSAVSVETPGREKELVLQKSEQGNFTSDVVESTE